MKIKRLDIVGFKSFVDRVSLDFEAGISAILGPNGCGKSNIVDAIRWVMGEQNPKHLRGQAMVDVIFGGSESRRPLSMAEVSLTFANADGLAPPALRAYAEIMVTRRLFRNGDSEYLLNKTPCRLLDVRELFMDTGVGARAYSIIEQGQIGMILNAKPEERRFLIEEAAGVTKFKSRKQAALRKIEATRQNLLRLGDIVAEVRRQLGSLQRQAQKAQTFRELREEFKAIEIRLAARQLNDLQQQRQIFASQIEKELRLQERLGMQRDAAEAELAQQRLRQDAAEQGVARGQERIFHLSGEIQQLEGRIEFGGRELETLERQRQRLAAECDEVARRLATAEEDAGRLLAERQALDAELTRASQRLSAGESALGELVETEDELTAGLEAQRTALYRTLTELSRLGTQQEEAERRLQRLTERQARQTTEVVTIQEQLAAVRDQSDVLAADLAGRRVRQTALEQERDQLRLRLESQRCRGQEQEALLKQEQERWGRQSSRLESLRQLEANLEGYASGVRTVLGHPPFRASFPALVADVLDVEPGYETAVEAVLGERLQALLAVDGQAAQEAFEFLGQQRGRCTFLLPLRNRAIPSLADWGTPLLDRVGLLGDGAKWLRPLLAGVCLVESLQPFLTAALPEGLTLVTCNGQILTWRGEFTGGASPALDHGLLHRRQEIKTLTAQVAAAESALAIRQQGCEVLRLAIAQGQQDLAALEASRLQQALELVAREKDAARQAQELSRYHERLELLTRELEQLRQEQAQLAGQEQESRQRRAALEREERAAESVLARQQEQSLVLRRQVATLREEVTVLKVAVAGLRERLEGGARHHQQLLKLQAEWRGRVALQQRQQQEGLVEQERLLAEQARCRVEGELLQARRDEERAALGILRDEFEAGAQQLRASEAALQQLRLQLSKVQETLAAAQLQARELDLAAEHLCQTFAERYAIDLAAETASGTEPCDSDAAEQRLRVLRRQIETLGEINLTAIDEHREADERYQFLIAQQDDLNRSLDGLQTAIARINRTTRKRFRETFDLVNGKFQEVFPRLFRGGQAELRLTDEEDLLETGLDIVVQPPGKRLQSVNLLSGGEKALAAVALIFAIFLVKPAPFCLLDEVDAPLDEANIGRFNALVREMAAKSQFVIITHNQRTMTIADTLFGVTMEEPGVSKLVAVRFNENSPELVAGKAGL